MIGKRDWFPSGTNPESERRANTGEACAQAPDESAFCCVSFRILHVPERVRRALNPGRRSSRWSCRILTRWVSTATSRITNSWPGCRRMKPSLGAA